MPPAMHLHLMCLKELTLGQEHWRANPLLLLFPHNVCSAEIHILLLTGKGTSRGPYDSERSRSEAGCRQLDIRSQRQSSVVLVLTCQMSTLFSNHRKINHQTARARTRRKDIMKGIRGDGKALEERRHFLRALCSSGIGIETLGAISSFSRWGKVLSVGLSGLLLFSSPCSNRARSWVCFHSRRSRKTER